jgi:adenylate kinase
MKMNLVLLGPQGCGKGTQAEMLSARFKLPIIAVGELYREEIRKKTTLGKRAESFVQSGELVPEKLTEELIKKELKKKKYQHGVIWDGFPRNLEQAEYLEKNIRLDWVIFLDISVKESIKRLGGRWVCVCGKTYNIKSDKAERPKHDLTCDDCGRKLKQRPDDKPEAIKERLKIYRRQTLPLIKRYQKHNKLIKINGAQKVDKVFKDILGALIKRDKNDNL